MPFSTCDSTCIHQLISSFPSSTHNGRKHRNHRYDCSKACSSREYVTPVLSQVNGTNREPQRRRPPTSQAAQPSLAPSPTLVPAAQAALLPPPPPPPPSRLSQKRSRVLVQDLTISSSGTTSRGTTLSNYQHTISPQSMKMENSGEQPQARQLTKYRLLTSWIGSLTYQEGRRVEALCSRCWIRRSGIMYYDVGGREET